MTSRKRTAKAVKKAKSSESSKVSMTAFVKTVMKLHGQKKGKARGACLVADPLTGEERCMLTTPEACTAVKGKWLGGSC